MGILEVESLALLIQNGLSLPSCDHRDSKYFLAEGALADFGFGSYHVMVHQDGQRYYDYLGVQKPVRCQHHVDHLVYLI